MKKIITATSIWDVLDVEDEALISQGFTIIKESDGLDLYESVLEESPDLVILDPKLESLDGYKICSMIKERKDLIDIPVVLVNVPESERPQGQECGCDEFHTGTVLKGVLLDVIHKYLTMRVRRHLRAPVRFNVTFHFKDEERTGASVNISRSGIFVETLEPIEEGALIFLEFNLPGSNDTLKVMGEVARVVDEETSLRHNSFPGMGIRFLDFPADAQEMITHFESLLADDEDE